MYQDWLIPTPRDNNNRPQQPEKESFPRPPQREDGSYIYDRVPEYNAALKVTFPFVTFASGLGRFPYTGISSKSQLIPIPTF